jgi:CRISPR system Cascade subunit CasE
LDRRNAAMRIGVLDLEGVLVVSDPARLCHCLAHGFGRAKAFGCGLMMIRRA